MHGTQGDRAIARLIVPSPGMVVSSRLPVSADAAGSAAVGASRIRRLDIQGLRAIAILMVVAFHSGLPVPGGFVWVDVFFVISGFVITAMLMREWATTGRIRFGRFYVRRFKRLTPALALMVAVTMIISVFVLSPLGTQQTAAKTAFGAILLVANLVIARTTGGYFSAPAEINPLLNVWSLSVEEQFYLGFPAILAVGWLLARKPAPQSTYRSSLSDPSAPCRSASSYSRPPAGHRLMPLHCSASTAR